MLTRLLNASVRGLLRQQRPQGEPGIEDQAAEIDRDEEGAPGHPGGRCEELVEVVEAARLVQVGQQRHGRGEARRDMPAQPRRRPTMPGSESRNAP